MDGNHGETTPVALSDEERRALMTEAQALEAAGRRAVDAADYAAARTAFAQELALRRRLGERGAIIYGLFHLAWVLRFGQGQFVAARVLLEEALALADDLDSPLHLGAAYGDLGDLALDEGDYAAATRLLTESLIRLTPLTRDAGTNGALLEGMALAAAGQGQWRRALHLFGAASALREAAGIPQTQPAVVARFTKHLAPARAALGPEAARAAEAQGRGMDLDQALAYALMAADDDPVTAG